MRRTNRRALRALLAACAICSGQTAGVPAAAALPGAPCVVEISTDPSRAVAGQQVLYRARILRRLDVTAIRFVEPIAFPNIRTAWLPGRAEEAKVERNGTTYLVREEHRALFPARAGVRALPTFLLRCELADGEPYELALPSTTLEVIEPPAKGRPADWSGVIGPLHAQLLADGSEIMLGESVRLSVLIRGRGNLWVLEEPLASNMLPGAEIFRRAAEIDTEAGERLYSRRFFRMDVVPHTAGRLQVPSIDVPYYDPNTGSYATARTEPLEIRVRERSADAKLQRLAAEESRERASTTTSPRRAAGAQVGWVVAAAVAVVLGLVATRLWRSHASTRMKWNVVAQALEDATVAAQRRDVGGESAALAAALRTAAAIADARRSARHRSAVEDMLETLDRSRFSGEAERPDAEAVAALISGLRTTSRT